MKKSIKIVVISIIIIIVLVAILIFTVTRNNLSTTRLLDMYNKMIEKKEYSFVMEEKDENIDFKISMSQKGDNFSIDNYMDGEHSTTLALGNEIYYIMHDEQEYYALEEDDEYVDLESDIYILESGLKEITKKEYTSGNEEINGKTYYYEEFDNEDFDFILFADIDDTSKVRTRFYFDGNDIKYIKNFVENENEEETEELINVSLKYETDENLFKIPEDYAETE